VLIKEGRHDKDFELQIDMIDGDAEQTPKEIRYYKHAWWNRKYLPNVM
jgi:hypothetical protein